MVSEGEISTEMEGAWRDLCPVVDKQRLLYKKKTFSMSERSGDLTGHGRTEN